MVNLSRTGCTGFVLADKPVGMSSNLLVGRLRQHLGFKKIGHTGTLDRFASGLMLLLTRQATSLSDYFLHTDKSYEAVFSLGIATDTHDPNGKILQRTGLEKTRIFLIENEDEIKSNISGWKNRTQQIPPLYSALKTGGRRYSDLARAGLMDLPAVRNIIVYNSSIVNYDILNGNILVEMSVSGGTYIRAFARDLSEELKFPVYLSSLRRTRLGQFTINDKNIWKPPYSRDKLSENEIRKFGNDIVVGNISKLFPKWPKLRFKDENEMGKLRNGIKVNLENLDAIPVSSCFFISTNNGIILAWAVRTRQDYKFKKIFMDHL